MLDGNLLVVEAVPSSFVASDMKAEGEGSGEAKLHIGSTQMQDDFEDFFQFDTQYSYQVDKASVLQYMHEVRFEYTYQKFNSYRKANDEIWQRKYDAVADLPDDAFFIQMTKFISGKRFYVRSQPGDVFYRQLRELIVPRITDITFTKDEENERITIGLQLNLECGNINDEVAENEGVYETEQPLNLPRNRILFGAPGTGKSHQLKEDQIEYFRDEEQFERVTFHPAYSYAQFFGTYKPVSEGDDIRYRFVPGPFLRILLRAFLTPERNYLLIIEEINRADVAAVFGDVFQLLDRDETGMSEYSIDMPEDLQRYLEDYQSDDGEYPYHGLLQDTLENGKLFLPSNLYLWATMNSADQGVMPLDTAFKRRWQFTYIGVDYRQDDADFGPFTLGDGKKLNWLEIRGIVNRRLKDVGDITEDRLLGPFFLRAANAQTDEEFCNLFKSKVLMYLYQDVSKYAGSEIFDHTYPTYSELCDAFDQHGMAIFPQQEA